MLDLDGRRYIITGAANGIGRATAYTLAACGAKLLLIDLNEEKLGKVREELGDCARALHVDLTDYDALKTGILNDVAQNGKINGFIHCAGLPYVAPVRSINADKAKRVYDVNVYAAIELAKITTSRQVKADTSLASVLISSVYGIVGSPANAVYSATKGAIVSLTKALAMEYAPKGIRFNCVAPGFVKTEMLGSVSGSFDSNYVNNLEALHPLGLGEPNAIAEPIAFLLSDSARWITGAILSVDGGFTAQ